MGSEPTTLPRKPSADLMAIVAVGVTVILSTFGQAAWLDGKIERQGTNLRGEIERLADRLDLKINSLQHGQVEIRERLAGVESGLEAVESRLDGVESRLDGVESRPPGRRGPPGWKTEAAPARRLLHKSRREPGGAIPQPGETTANGGRRDSFDRLCPPSRDLPLPYSGR